MGALRSNSINIGNISSNATAMTFSGSTSQWNTTLNASDWNNANTGFGIQFQVQTAPPNEAALIIPPILLTIWYYFDVTVASIFPTGSYGSTAAGGAQIQINLNGVLSQVTSISDVKCQVGTILGVVTNVSYSTQPPFVLCIVPTQTVS